MKKTLLLVSALLALLVAAYFGIFYVFKMYISSTLSADSIQFETRDEYFSVIPQGSDNLTTQTALNAYRDYVANKPKTSAMAQSDSGAWGYVSEASDAEDAAEQAIEYCRSYNQTFEEKAPCHLVYLHGQWLNEQNRALDILKDIPQWQPSEAKGETDYIAEARRDFSSGDTDLALAKSMWLFQKGEFEDNYGFGMDAYFAASLWQQIANEYPPARVLMHYAAIQLKEKTIVASNFSPYHAREFIRLNRRLYFNSRSIDLFMELRESHPEKAMLIYHSLEDILLEAEMFEVMEHYISPEKDYSRALSEYESNMENQILSEATKDVSNKSVKTQIAQLIAILVNNNRLEEAQAIADKAIKDIDDAHFHNVLAQALKGKVFTTSNYNEPLVMEQ